MKKAILVIVFILVLMSSKLSHIVCLNLITLLWKKSFPHLKIGREGDVNFLSIWSDTVQQKGVVHGAIPCYLKAIKCPEK